MGYTAASVALGRARPENGRKLFKILQVSRAVAIAAGPNARWCVHMQPPCSGDVPPRHGPCCRFRRWTGRKSGQFASLRTFVSLVPGKGAVLVAPARGEVDRKQATDVSCETVRPPVGPAGCQQQLSGPPSRGQASPVVSRLVLGTASVAGGRPALCLGLNHATPKGFKSEVLPIYYPSHPTPSARKQICVRYVSSEVQG